MLTDKYKRKRLNEYFALNEHLRADKVAEAAGTTKQALCNFMAGRTKSMTDERFGDLRRAIKILTLKQSKYF